MNRTVADRIARAAGWIGVVVIAFVLGWFLRGGGGETPTRPGPARPATETAEVWTCSMHPQVRRSEPGPCPICFMDLVPAGGADAPDEADGRRLVLSEQARRLARVRTAPVTRRFPDVEVRMVGKIDYDETRVASITPYVAGRLDRLYVDYTWIPVQRGDHLVEIYSPELVAAQQELLEAIRAERALASSDLAIMRETAAKTVEAAREKLRLLGMQPAQIERLESRGTASEHVTLYSPINGVVIEKNATQGMYVDTGTRLFTVADLSTVWVRLEAYESDLEWVHLGQEVEFTVEALPGETFRGRVSFIDPAVDPRTRTVRLRVHVPNPEGRLKPEMLVRAEVHARVAGHGRVFDPYLAGKWISPMHPWIVKERPGSCDVCGMKLVRAEELGYASGREGGAPLVVPTSAPLITGTRAVVYVETDGPDGPAYEGREIVLGPRANDGYIVEAGLSEGERVVVEGNFKIDSALQIQAKPSMMNPEGGTPTPRSHGHGLHGPGPDHATGASGDVLGTSELTPVFQAYLEVGGALATDDEAAAREAYDRLESRIAERHRSAGAEGEAHLSAAHAAAIAGRNAAGLDGMRAAFHDLSSALVALARERGHGIAGGLRVVHCPMTPRGGSDWLQNDDVVANPYFGAAMLRCGSVTEVVPPSGS